MALILIPGTSGSGKSHMLFERILREARQHPDRRFIVLVPEQNTLMTQKKLVLMSRRSGIWNIDVLSFTRLAYRVFEQTGVERRQILSETGKILLLRLIAERESSRIPILSGVLDRPGSLAELKSILSEMDQYGIGPEQLKDMEREVRGAGSHPALARKLSEIALLQETCERYQEGHFITGEKLPRVLSGKAPLDESLKGVTIALDAFTGFTPAQLQVITVLLGIAKEIYVTVTIDPGILQPGTTSFKACTLSKEMRQAIRERSLPGPELFSLSVRSIQALLRCADEAGTGVELLPVPEGKQRRHRPGGELAHLEKHILRTGRGGTRPYAKDGARHEIFLRQCADPWDEAVSAAVTIEELIRRGIRYREIAIVCGSLKDYAEYVRRAMSVYEIPCYIDKSAAVVLNPAFEFVRCAIDILEKNYSYESVIALLRTGLALDAESGETDLLENYLLAAGIRGSRMWSAPFTRRTRKDDQELKDTAEHARSEFMERFGPFAEEMKKSSSLFRSYAGAVWNLILAFDVPEKLELLSSRCREEGREARAQEYAQVLRVISDVLDEAALLIGEEKVTRTQFAQILQAGFSEAKIGILPRGIDQVQVGDLERSRLDEVRVVLFLGLNDEYVPHRKQPGGVLTDPEREYLVSRKVPLAPTAREDANIQQFYLYLTLTRPSEELYLSWSAAKRNGEEMRPSGILRNLQAMFPRAAWVSASSAAPFESVSSLRTASGVLSQALGDYLHADRAAADWNEPKLRELVNLFRREEKAGREETLAYLKDLTSEVKAADLDGETAIALYGTILRGSITRLEEFSGCAFRHFAHYGLGLQEREEFAVRSIDIGNLLHHAVEIFSSRLRDGSSASSSGPWTWRNLTDEQRDTLARDALKEALELEHAGDLYTDTGRSAQTLARCERILLRSVKTMQRQICQSAFEPALFELSFGEGDPDSVWINDLPGGGRMRLGGKIDRIDECGEEDAKRLYVKIVDYKSSSRDIELERLIEGEQLQLIVYLDAALSLEQKAHPEKEIVCAGAFYYAFQEPMVEMTPDMTPEELEDLTVGSMRVKGLVNGRADVVERLDRGLSEPGPSLVIPVIRNKNPGELRASDNVITDRQFELLREYAKDRMRRAAASILSGQTAPNPSRMDTNTTSCTFCPYHDVCGFDPHGKGMRYRERAKRSSKENWEIIGNTVSGKDTSCRNGQQNKSR